jgi:hypothetical protein
LDTGPAGFVVEGEEGEEDGDDDDDDDVDAASLPSFLGSGEEGGVGEALEKAGKVDDFPEEEEEDGDAGGVDEGDDDDFPDNEDNLGDAGLSKDLTLDAAVLSADFSQGFFSTGDEEEDSVTASEALSLSLPTADDDDGNDAFLLALAAPVVVAAAVPLAEGDSLILPLPFTSAALF